MHKVSGCTSSGSDIASTNCSGQKCHMWKTGSNYKGLYNLKCQCGGGSGDVTYMMSTKGSNVCKQGYSALTTYDSCAAAAKALGKTMYSNKSWSSSSYPQGCWLWYTGMMYFNNYKSSKTHTSTTKVCKKGTTQQTYAMMTKGSNVCKSGYAQLTTYDSCAAAAKSYGKKMYASKSWSTASYPYGCWMWTSGMFYFNNYKSSKTHTSTVKICKKGSGGGSDWKYAAMNKGSNVCRSGTATLTSYDQCAGAAKAMGKKMYASRSWSSSAYPYGCWLWTSGMVYWNNAKTSKVHSSTTKLCRVTGGGTTVSYPLMSKGSNTCASGTTTIMSFDRCAMAAKANGKSIYNNKSWASSSYPYGCWMWTNGTYYFNNTKSSKTHSSTTKVCCKGCTTVKKYSLGTKGANACPSGKSMVMTRTECIAASKQWGKSISSSNGNWSTYPKGCFYFSNGTFYFNIHSTGKGQSSSTPVCKAGSTQKMYAASSNGSATCPNGYQSITHVDQCTAAAKQWGKSFVRAASYTSFPMGCFQYNNNAFYFNTGRTGKASSSAKIVCVKSGSRKTYAPTARKTPAPTPAPTRDPTASTSTFKDFDAWMSWCKAGDDRCSKTTMCGKEKKGKCKYAKNSKKIKCKKIKDMSYCKKLRCDVKCKGKGCKKESCTGKAFTK
jgi:hypothetical protein